MRKSVLVTLGLVFMIAISLAFTHEDEPKYKNLKILPKDITEKQMDSVMHSYTDALNVKCNFCHVRSKETGEWDHASDANKHKLVARDMMKMTSEINKQYFDLTGAEQTLSTPLMVTCYTCHHGLKEPVTMPAKEKTPPAEAPKQQ